VQVNLAGRRLSAKLQMPDSSVWEKSWELYAPVNEASLKVKVTAFKIELTVDKQSPGDWKRLEGTASEGVVVRENNLASGHVPPPYSSGRDWNAVEAAAKEEFANEKDGQDPFQQLMKSMYADADEETRRAMIKSYQTSGGTVLNMNWKEVRDKDFEKEGITPPAGQEVRKWGE